MTAGSATPTPPEPAREQGTAAGAVPLLLLRCAGAGDARETPLERREMLLTWHEDEPVDEEERHRHAALVERRGNRGPLLDHPALAETVLPDLAQPVPDRR